MVDGVRHQQRARLHRGLLEQQQDGGEHDPGLRGASSERSRAAVAPGGAGSTSRSKGSPRGLAGPAPGRVRAVGWPSGVVVVGRRLPCRSSLVAAGSRRALLVLVGPDIRRAYSALLRSSSWWVPTAVIRPAESSATRSASSTVDGRWATISAVVSASTCAQRGLHQGLRVHVQRRQRVVQDQEARPADHRAGQREALALTAGQAEPLLADLRVRALRQGVHEVGLRDGQRPVQLAVAGAVAGAHQHVLADARREQRRLLEGHGDQGAQLARGTAP